MTSGSECVFASTFEITGMRGLTISTWGRCRGDVGEMQGICRGDVGEV